MRPAPLVCKAGHEPPSIRSQKGGTESAAMHISRAFLVLFVDLRLSHDESTRTLSSILYKQHLPPSLVQIPDQDVSPFLRLLGEVQLQSL